MSGVLPAQPVDVLVVGGGIAGATLHYRLARAGVRSLLVDEGAERAEGASSVPAALLNPNRGRSGRASLADQEGMEAFWRLIAELGASGFEAGARRSGVLRVADNARQARYWRRLPSTTWLEPRDVPAAYHAPFGAMLVERGGWVKPGALLKALELAAAASGCPTVRGAAVTDLSESGAGVTAATTAGAVAARKAVLCTGATPTPRIRQPAFEVVWGEALVLHGGARAPYPLAGAVVAAFDEGPGSEATIYVTGGHSAAPASGPLAPGAVHPLQEALAWKVPTAAGARLIGAWTGARAKRPSGEPVARRLTRHVHLLGALGGRGFLRAATLAETMAERLRSALLE